MQSAKYLTVPLMLCRTLAWSPLWMLILSLRAPDMLLPCTGILTACAVLSVLAVRAFRLHFRPAAAAVCGLLTVLPAAVLCGYLLRQLSGSLFSACLLTAVTFFAVIRGSDSEPDQMFPITAYAAFLTGTVLSYALLYSAALPVSGAYVLGITGLLSACYFLLRNQLMLLKLAGRRSTVTGDVPADIRRGNLMLAVGMILLLAFVFCFRAPLLQLLILMQNGAKKLAFAILTAVTNLISRLGGDAPVTQDVSSEPDTVQMPAGKSNPLWLLLWLPVFAAACYIWHMFLSEWFYACRDALAGMIRRLRGDAPEQAESRTLPEEASYFDTAVLTRPERSQRQKRRIWRKKLRAWERLPDSSAKFYAGYRLLLEAPVWTASELRDADTAEEIRRKWMRQHLPEDALDQVTDDFHAERYAMQALPPHAIANLTKTLKKLI